MLKRLKPVIALFIIAVAVLTGFIIYLALPPERAKSRETLLNLIPAKKLEFQIELRNCQSVFEKLLDISNKPEFAEYFQQTNYKQKLKYSKPLLNNLLFSQTAVALSADKENFIVIARQSNLANFLCKLGSHIFNNKIIPAEKTGLSSDLFYETKEGLLYLSNNRKILSQIFSEDTEKIKTEIIHNSGINTKIHLSDRLREKLSDKYKLSLSSVDNISQSISCCDGIISVSTKAPLSKEVSEYIIERDKAYPIKVAQPEIPFINNKNALISINATGNVKAVWDVICRKLFDKYMEPSLSENKPETILRWNFINNVFAEYSNGGYSLNIGKAVSYKNTAPVPQVEFAATFSDTKKALAAFNYELGNMTDYSKAPTGNPAWDAITGDSQVITVKGGGELKLNKLFCNGLNPVWKTCKPNVIYFSSHKNLSNDITSRIETKLPENPAGYSEKELADRLLDIKIKWQLEKEEAEHWQEYILEKAVSYNWAAKKDHRQIKKLTDLLIKIAETKPTGASLIILTQKEGRCVLYSTISLKF